MKKRELFNSKVKAKGQAIEPRDGSRPIVYVMAATCMSLASPSGGRRI